MTEPRDFEGTIDLDARKVLDETRDFKGIIDLKGTIDLDATRVLEALPSDEVNPPKTEP